MNELLGRLKDLIDSIVNAHVKIGFNKIILYVIFAICVYGLLNFRSCVVGTVEFFSDISDDIHKERMILRDQYVTDLSPILSELRSEVGADRILYFEFHNSEQNLDNIPFKFFDLILSNCHYGVSEILGESYKNINSSMYIRLFNDLSKGEILFCSGEDDTAFKKKYEGVYKLFNETDHSCQQAFISVPGTKQPMGFIVLEWLDPEKTVNLNTKAINEFLPRINAISVSISKR
jgi:hypothetical protein